MGSRRGRRIPAVGKRKRSRTFTANKRQRTVTDTAGYLQWKRYKYAKNLGALTLAKQLSCQRKTLQLTWRAIQKLAGNGILWMDNYTDNVSNPNLVYRPIYLVDLTSTIVQGAGAMAVRAGSPVFGLKRTLATTPQYDLVAIQGQTPTQNTGVRNVTTWTTTYGGSGSWNNSTYVTACVRDRAILQWAEIRVDLWGSQQQPCEYTLTLCQFDDRVLPPEDSTTIVDRQAVDWWDQLSAKLVFNPSIRKSQNGFHSNMIKVLDRKTFVINPTATYESDTDPHCKSVRLFYRMNRKVNLAYRNALPGSYALNQDGGAAWLDVDTGGTEQNYTTPQPKARVFFMITCANWRGTQVGATQTKADTGSINLEVNTQWIDP